MARPKKKGFDYFPLDVNFMHDERMIPIRVHGGVEHFAVAVGLLCGVYRNGYYMEWSELSVMKVAADVMVGVDVVEQTIDMMVKYGFFDRRLANEERVLTSVEIQERYMMMKRGPFDFDAMPYRLVGDGKRRVSAAEIVQNDAKTEQNSAETPSDGDKIDQKPIKESKEKVKKNKQKKILPSGSIAKKDESAPAPPQDGNFKDFSLKEITLDEVKALCQLPEVARLRPEYGDADDFYAYYAARGWMASSGVPIRSCKDALIAWLRRRGEFAARKGAQHRDVPSRQVAAAAAAQPKQRRRDEDEEPESSEPRHFFTKEELDAFLKQHNYGRP